MDQGTHRSVVLLPIHQEYAEAILSGRKRVELRKTRFGRHVSHVLLYVTSPLRRIVGYFEVKGVSEAAPSALWRRYRHDVGVSKQAFDTYFGGNKRGVAIGVGRVRHFGRHVRLDEIGVRAPQSFVYLSPSAFDALCCMAQA